MRFFAIVLVAALVEARLDSKDDSIVDVVIVGAGYAGLTLAKRLSTLGNKSVHIIEALDRVGGRAYDETIGNGNYTIENGVAFIGSPKQQPFANAMMNELGMDTYEFPVWGPADCRKQGVLDCKAGLLCRQRNGEINEFNHLFPDILSNKCVGDKKAILSLLKVTAELSYMAKQVDLEEPWKHPKAQEWDGQTFGSWLRNRMDPTGLDYMRLTIQPDLCEDVDSVSLLHALFLSNAGGGVFDGLYAFNNVRRIHGGGQAPAKKLAASLNQKLVSLSLSDHVIKIEQTKNFVKVYSTKGVTQARYAVVTGVPSVTSKIDFDPPLPPNKQKSLDRMHGGTVVRVMAVYNQGPFWRNEKKSGSFGDLTPYTLTTLGYDMTPSDPNKDGYVPNTGVPGVIQVETVGSATSLYSEMSYTERYRNFTNSLAYLFGNEARNATKVLAFDFSSMPTLGGGKSSYPPGMWTQVGKYLREPHGRVHWAGTEYSSFGFGYMEGALRSANKTATTLLGLLKLENAQGDQLA